MRTLIICDKNKEVTDAAKKLIKEYGFGVFDEVKVINGDVIKVHEKTPNSRIVTASNPEFSPDGGLDKLLANKYEWTPQEFFWNDDLFFVKSVDSRRKSSKDILLRAAVGILGYSHEFIPILTGIGTGVGGVAITVFAEILKAILSNLNWANLSSANLSWANLRSADLSSANLSWANLSSADLRSAKEARKCWNELNILKFQTGKLRAFKYVDNDGMSPIQSNGAIKYKVGKSYSLKKDDCNYSELENCGSGLNVATLEWCLREMREDSKLIEVEFNAKDIVSIPFSSDGKFRVRKLKVVKEWSKKEIKDYLKKEIK